jgi:hypothetical protein
LQKQVDTPFATWESRPAHGNKTLKKVKIMRTRTMILSALLGGLGSVSVMAQTNVYSLNAVGYINVTVQPGFNIITCPLIETPDNTVGTVLNNSTGALTGSSVYFWFPTATPPAYSEDNARTVGTLKGQTTNPDGWSFDGTNVAAPGTGFWFDSAASSNITLTFVGTVPTGPITNTLVPGFNLVGSVVPMSGDIVTNPISALTNYTIGDVVYTYNSSNTPVYAEYTSVPANSKAGGHGYLGEWTSFGDPVVPNVGQGFWYDASATVNWVEDYSVSQ